MASGRIITGIALAASGLTLLARIRGNSGQLATQGSFSAINWQATNLQTGIVAGSGSFTPSAVLFNALVQNDPRWSQDSANQPGDDGAWGYNFLAQLNGAALFPSTPPAPPPLTASPATPYQIDLAFTPADGSPAFRVSFQAPVIPVYV
jgi:hypothetical protein